jgi:hypothetical protein
MIARQPLVARDRGAMASQQLLDDDRVPGPSSGSSSSSSRGIEHQRAADGQHLLLAARELVAEVALALGQARKQLVDALPASTGRGGPRRVRFSCTVSDLKMLRSCGTQPMPAARRARGPAARIAAGPPSVDAAGMAARDADQRVDEGRLAGAVAAQQRQRPAFGQREATRRCSTTASP